MRPIDLAHGPAAFTTSGVAMLPREVWTSATRLPVEANAGHLGFADDLHALGLRALGEAHRHAVRIGHAVGGAIGRALDAGHVEAGRQRLRLGRGEPLHVDAARLLQLHVLAGRWRRARPSTAGRGSRPGGSRSACRPPLRTAPSSRSTRSTGRCWPDARTGGARRRRSCRSSRWPAAPRARSGRRWSGRAGRGARPRCTPMHPPPTMTASAVCFMRAI